MPRAWRIYEYAGYKGLKLETEPRIDPGPGEVRVRVGAFALNWGDMDLMEDRYSFSFSKFPARVGIEAAGTIDAIGDGVADWAVGDRVSTLPYFYDDRGASAESLLIDARYVTMSPTNLSTVESASIWMQYMTAYFPLTQIVSVGPGTHVLVTAATSTAGAAALQIGRLLGAKMIATTRFEANIEYLHRMGADHVLVPSEQDMADELKQLTDGDGLDLVLDSVGKGLIARYSPALARNAHICFYGKLDGSVPILPLPLVDMYQKNATFRAYSVFNYIENPEMLAKGKAFIYDMLEKNNIRSTIDRVYPMEELIEAFEYMSHPRSSHGKIVIETGLSD